MPAIGEICCDSAAVLGDIHLGRRPRSPDFSADPSALRALVDELLARRDRVVLVGDVLDLDRGPLPFSPDREARALLELHGETVDVLRDPRIIWIAGNHDWHLLRLGLARTAVDLRVGRRRVRVEHGHRWDVPLKQARRFAHLVTWTHGRIDRLGLDSVARLVHLMGDIATGGAGGPSPIEEGALRWLQENPRYDAVVVGHTHEASLRAVGDRRVVVNAGSCLAEPFHYVDIVAGDPIRVRSVQSGTHADIAREGQVPS